MDRAKATSFYIAVVFAVMLAGVFMVHGASAATLSFSPSSGTYLSGRSFTVTVQVSSEDQALNAVQGQIFFPADKLEVLSVSKANSILNLWVQDPTFSNYDGTVNFSGVAVNPGFQGTSATVLTITFAAKGTGDTPVAFITSAVLANDGQGTNILTSTSVADFTLIPLAGNSSAGGSPAVPASGIDINSTPALARGSWNNIDQITFNWSVPANAQGVDYTISTNSNLQLPDVSQGMVSQAGYDLSPFADGVWYFFVSFESGSAWSPPAVMRLMLDRTPPAPFVLTRVDVGQTNTRPVFAWTTSDAASGMDYYEVKIGDGDWFNASVIQNGSSSYMLPPQSPTAARTLTVRAFDKAGNYRDATADFTVLGPVVPCAPGDLSCVISLFFVRWGAVISIIFICLVIVLYGFLYYLLWWSRQTRRELQNFKEELQSDLKRLEAGVQGVGGVKYGADSRQSLFLEEKRSLEKEIRHIMEDVKEEIKRLQNEK